MSVRSDRGRAGEEYVCSYLENKGWKIERRNYRIRGGEIDIIASKDDTVAFVEVKSRKFGSIDEAIEAIDRRKQSLVIRAAGRYLNEFPAGDKSVRFDAAAVTVTTEDIPRVLEMKYYENAFDTFF